MYWSEYDGITGSIHKASMNGEGKQVLVNKIGRVISITSDYDNGLLYWTTLTPSSGSIESIDLEGRRQNKIMNVAFGYPTAITYFKVKIILNKFVNICIFQRFYYFLRDVCFGWILLELIIKSVLVVES